MNGPAKIISLLDRIPRNDGPAKRVNWCARCSRLGRLREALHGALCVECAGVEAREREVARQRAATKQAPAKSVRSRFEDD